MLRTPIVIIIVLEFSAHTIKEKKKRFEKEKTKQLINN